MATAPTHTATVTERSSPFHLAGTLAQSPTIHPHVHPAAPHSIPDSQPAATHTSPDSHPIATHSTRPSFPLKKPATCTPLHPTQPNPLPAQGAGGGKQLEHLRLALSKMRFSGITYYQLQTTSRRQSPLHPPQNGITIFPKPWPSSWKNSNFPKTTWPSCWKNHSPAQKTWPSPGKNSPSPSPAHTPSSKPNNLIILLKKRNFPPRT